jgi:flagellin-like hook-associated protein FlgL
MSGVLVGQRVFCGNDRGDPVFLGHTGAAAGLATSNARGDVYLQVYHKETTVLADPDGVNLKLSANPDFTDTVLGQHDLIVDVSQKTISFAAGGPVTHFNGTETSLKVTNSDGDAIYVDVSGLNGALGSPATVTIRSDGLLSVDRRVAPVELTDFTRDNIAVADADGRVLYVDATGIRRTGLEPVRIPGTYDLFGALIAARDVLLDRRQVPQTDQTALLQGATDALNEVLSGITQTMTSVGGRLQALDTLKQSIADIKATADDQAGLLENADLVQVAAEIARTQTLYQMTLATASRLLSLSLLDYI